MIRADVVDGGVDLLDRDIGRLLARRAERAQGAAQRHRVADRQVERGLATATASIVVAAGGQTERQTGNRQRDKDRKQPSHEVSSLEFPEAVLLALAHHIPIRKVAA